MVVDGVQDLILFPLDTLLHINMMALERIVLEHLCVQDIWICIQRRVCPVFKAVSDAVSEAVSNAVSEAVSNAVSECKVGVTK
jgi:hypothetical protein